MLLRALAAMPGEKYRIAITNNEDVNNQLQQDRNTCLKRLIDPSVHYMYRSLHSGFDLLCMFMRTGVSGIVGLSKCLLDTLLFYI